MATRMRIGNNTVHGVYDDRWASIYRAIGRVTIQRATSVEYDHTLNLWVATHIETGQVIGSSSCRKDAIEQEVQWLEENHVTHNHRED